MRPRAVRPSDPATLDLHERARRKAAAGARYLDKRVKGWEKLVRRSRLRMRKGSFYPDVPGDCGCILAQINAATRAASLNIEDAAGSWSQGAADLVLSSPTQHRLGFLAYDDEAYEALDAGWKAEIRERVGR